MNYFIIILLAILSYILGSIPNGYLLAKHVKKIDLTQYGSKNTGATNTSRVLGLGYGLLALLLDLLKGIILLVILVSFKLENYYIIKLENYYIIKNINILPIYGLLSALGHVFSIFLKFRGGKAVATSGGILIFFAIYLGAWQLVLGAIGVFILTVIITNYISLGSILGSFTALVLSIIYHFIDKSFIPLEFMIGIVILASVIIIKHHENIKRLFNGTENKFKLKKSNK